VRRTGQLVRSAKSKARTGRRSDLLSRIPKGAVCAEIGVWKGGFSARILQIVEPRKLHLIDPWVYQEEFHEALYGDMAGGQDFMDAVYESVASRFRDEIEHGTVELHREYSQDAASRFRDDYFDFVYVDGNHVYEYVKQDLELFLPKLKRDALLAGDDYHNRGWWGDGVTRAVDELASGDAVDLVSIDRDQFVLRKR
jgi:hypothetical protein